jgi:ArsR family transcriptional regulator
MGDSIDNGDEYAQYAKYIKALAEPERLRILQCLREGRLAVGEIGRKLGTPLQNVSHHLKMLRTAGLVRARREGRRIFYELPPYLMPQGASGANSNVLDFGCCRVKIQPKLTEGGGRGAGTTKAGRRKYNRR